MQTAMNEVEFGCGGDKLQTDIVSIQGIGGGYQVECESYGCCDGSWAFDDLADVAKHVQSFSCIRFLEVRSVIWNQEMNQMLRYLLCDVLCSLEVLGVHFVSEEVATEFFWILGICPNKSNKFSLDSLKLDSVRFAFWDWALISICLCSLEQVSFTNCGLDDGDLKSLKKMLSGTPIPGPMISSLDLSNNHFSIDGIRGFQAAMRYLPSLTHLNFRGNPAQDDSEHSVASSYFRSSRSLKEFHI